MFAEDYEPGETVALTALPATGRAFRHWTGVVGGTSATVHVTMTSDKTVDAVFEQIQEK